MEKERYRKLAVGLGILWLVSVFVLFAAYYGVSVGVANARGVHTVEVFSEYSDILLCVAVVYLLPLCFFVQRYARKGQMKALAIIGRILFIYEAVCAGLLVCVRVVMLIVNYIQY